MSRSNEGVGQERRFIKHDPCSSVTRIYSVDISRRVYAAAALEAFGQLTQMDHRRNDLGRDQGLKLNDSEAELPVHPHVGALVEHHVGVLAEALHLVALGPGAAGEVGGGGGAARTVEKTGICLVCLRR